MVKFKTKFSLEFETGKARWRFLNPKMVVKIDRLVDDVSSHPYNGIGKPERLVNSPCWSRRIDGKHRLVYQVVEDTVWFVSCYGHYGDH